MAMVANLIKISVQKFKTRLYYLNTSAINVSVAVVCELSAELTVNIVGCVSDHAVFAFYDCAFRQSEVNIILCFFLEIERMISFIINTRGSQYIKPKIRT